SVVRIGGLRTTHNGELPVDRGGELRKSPLVGGGIGESAIPRLSQLDFHGQKRGKEVEPLVRRSRWQKVFNLRLPVRPPVALEAVALGVNSGSERQIGRRGMHAHSDSDSGCSKNSCFHRKRTRFSLRSIFRSVQPSCRAMSRLVCPISR